MLTFAVALKDKGVPVPEIAKKLTIKAGKNAGRSPSVASLYRALAEAEAAAADDGLPLRPTPVPRCLGLRLRGRETVRLTLDLAFTELGLHRVWAARAPRNEASAKTLLAAA